MENRTKKKVTKSDNPRIIKLQQAIGNSLKILRKGMGYTNYESFANAVELNRSQYGKYEAGRTNMRIGALLETALKFGLTEEDIFNKEFLTLGSVELNPLSEKSHAYLIKQVRHEVELLVGAKDANKFDDNDIERMYLILTSGLDQASKNQILKKIKLKSTTPNFETLLDFLISSKWIVMTHPTTPNRPDQKYYTTKAGKLVLSLGQK